MALEQPARDPLEDGPPYGRQKRVDAFLRVVAHHRALHAVVEEGLERREGVLVGVLDLVELQEHEVEAGRLGRDGPVDLARLVDADLRLLALGYRTSDLTGRSLRTLETLDERYIR